MSLFSACLSFIFSFPIPLPPTRFLFCCCCSLCLSHTLSPTIIIFSFFLIIYSWSFLLFFCFRFFVCFLLLLCLILLFLFFIFYFLQSFVPLNTHLSYRFIERLCCLTGLLNACAVLQVYSTHDHSPPTSIPPPRPLYPMTSTNLLTERKQDFPSQCKTGFRVQREDVFHGSKNIVWVIRSFLLECLDRRRQYK